MPLSLTRQEFVYNAGGTLAPLYHVPVQANRAPGTNDFALPGQIWVDTSTDSIYMLASITANSANWTTSPGSGVGVFTSVTVDPGDVDIVAGDLNVDAGNVDIAAGNLTVGGDFTVDGTATFNGDIDITSAQLIDLTSTLNAAPSILLQADGGTSEQIRLYSNQGTAVDSILLHSNVGGVTIRGDLATDDAINLSATNGGINADAVTQISIHSSESAADAISIFSSAGGIDIIGSGTAGEDIDIDTTASVNISASEAVADCITITASNAAGGITMDAGTGGIEIGNSATCSPIDIGDFVPTASRLITIAGGTVTTAVTDRVDIGVDGVSTNAGAAKQVDVASGNVLLGSSVVNINSGTAASGTSTVNISSGTGGGTKAVNIGNSDGLTTVNIRGVAAVNSSVNANSSMNAGTSTGTVTIGNALAGAVTVDSSAGISLDGAAASNFSVSGAGIDLSLVSAGGQLIMNAEEAAANALRMLSAAGGLDVNVALQMNLDSSQAAVDAIRIFASNAAGGIDLDYGTGGMTMTGANGAMTIATGTGAINVSADAAATTVNVGTGAAAKTVVVGSTTTTSTTTVRSGTGGIHLTAAGLVVITNATDTQASPSAASTLDVNFGSVVFTGFTTASAASQVFTITNALVTTTSPLIVTACNEGANDAQMTVMRVKRAAGSFEVTLKNNGAAALNGNVSITFMVGV